MTRDPSGVRSTFVNHASQLHVLHDALVGAERVAIDTEVPIDGPKAGELRVMSVATRSTTGATQTFVVDARDLDPTLLQPVLTGVTADAWNANFDARVIDAAVWQSSDTTPHLRWWDAQLGDALIHQGQSGVSWYHGLAWAAEHYLGLTATGKGTVQLSYTAYDDLSEEQIAYAAADAIETLWVADAIRQELHEAGLEQISDIEMHARPFLDQMERTGLPFDWPGWKAELDLMADQQRQVIGKLAVLTGGGQGTLFDDVVEPSWNPGSDRQVKAALNRWSEPEVLGWTTRRFRQARLLDETDSVTATVLREIGGELSTALLDYRSLTKTLTTYGESIHEHLHDDGRLRPQYLQVVGTNTGRLASRNPNAQNFTPRMLPHMRSDDPERVFVYADLSQAELRYLAQVADDRPLIDAFAADVDVHVSTAASMFDVDADALLRDDPERFRHLRKIAKALNFGIAYGTGASALARSLTAEGSPTSVDEATELLAQYRRTYPGTAAWAEDRIAEIRSIAEDTREINWELTLRLARGFRTVNEIRRGFRRDQNRWPSADEILDLHPDALRTERHALHDEISWLLKYSAPVALLPDGTPFTFASRTLSGRRQQFNLHLDRLFLVAITDAVRSNNGELMRVRSAFAHEHNLDLDRSPDELGDSDIARMFEERSLRVRYVDAISRAVGADAAGRILGRAAKDRASAMVNAWRNAPIQGGVADIMLCAYGDLAERLRALPSARPVQTVHDSVVIECDKADAVAVANEVRGALEAASLRFCPEVTPKADIDVRSSLSDSDVLDAIVV